MGTKSGVVAVLTFRRPGDLGELLPILLGELGTFGGSGTQVAFRGILVIDNDPVGSAGPVAAGIDRVRYLVEPTQGIAAARNRALDESAEHDLLVFIDDDERPEPGWLKAHVKAWTDFGADAVAGAVISEFEGELDPWVQAGGFFDRLRPATGTTLPVAATNNLLLDLEFVRRAGIRFDERYGLTGGEDTLFTRSLVAAGGSLIFCSEALVVDQVPRSRMTRRWAVARYLSGGNSWALTGMQVCTAGPARWKQFGVLTVGGLVRVLAGGTRATAGLLVRSDRWQATGLRTLARGTGLVLGAFGLRYQEYRRSPRRTHRTAEQP